MNDRPRVVGKGSCWEVRPGVWQYRHSLGKDPETGKYIHSPRRTIYTKKKTEVYAALEAYKIELNTGVAVKKTPATVGEYANRFHEEREGTMRSPLAYKREELDIKHINDLFGDVRLQQLHPSVIRQEYATVRKTGRYSESELHKIHSKLKQIMQQAVDDGLLLKNPCATISVPRPKGKERKALSVEEATRLLACLLEGEPDAHTIATLLMLDTGIRRGEALGLTWKHINPEGRTAYIAQQYASDKELRSPKSEAGVRRISLSDRTMSRLVEWRAIQAEVLKSYKLEQTGGTPVVHSLSYSTDDKGDTYAEAQFMDPNNFGRWFRNWCADNGFGSFEKVVTWRGKNGIVRRKGTGYKGLTPHMLRHTQATLLIGENTDIKTVSARLGHSTPNLTMSIYSHAIEAKDREAADVFSGLLTPKTDGESEEE